MGKKMEDAEVKKECPSCGLGVALDSTVCEFCGWDFEEEDEWILQIEKLERDLIIEKQKFEPGTVNHKIESTLHNPSQERIEQIRARQGQSSTEEVSRSPQPEKAPSVIPAPTPPSSRGPQKGMREARPAEIEMRQPQAPHPKAQEEVRAPSPARPMPQKQPVATTPVQPPTSGKVRRVRTVKVSGEQSGEVSADNAPGKARLVRKVKK